jgi:hypothetical protein
MTRTPDPAVQALARALCSTFDWPSHGHEAYLQPDFCEVGLLDASDMLGAMTPADRLAIAGTERDGLAFDLQSKTVGLCGRDDCRWQTVGAHHPHGADDFSEPVYMALDKPWAGTERVAALDVERLRDIFPALDWRGDHHFPHCSTIQYPGSTGPDPEPPDPCTCGGPEVFAALTADKTPGEDR